MNQEIEQYPVKNKQIACRVLGEEAMVGNLSESSFYNLNPVGTFIWKYCDGRHSVKEIGEALAGEYPVPIQEAIQDCLKFIQELVDEGLLSWSKTPTDECGKRG
jgi:methyltransferase-like protein